jgi:hypothetical protein
MMRQTTRKFITPSEGFAMTLTSLQRLARFVCRSAMLLVPATVCACPNCPNLGPPLAEQIDTADAALIVVWREGEKGDIDRGLSGKTVFEIRDVLRDQTGRLKPGQSLTLDSYREGALGDQFLILGSGESEIDWDPPLPMSDAAVRYLRAAPASTAPAAERLAYALRYLDDPDPVITNDAFTEFAAAKYDDVKQVVSGVTPQRVRAWLSDPKCDPLRIGFFGMLLGIVGSKEDAPFLEAKVLEPVEFRSGGDGLISGYLLLTHEEGLDLIDRSKLRDPEAVGLEKSAAMNALRFLWTYAPECIPKERLRASMRLMLDYPPLVDVAIVDLARWQDWSVMDRLVAIYGDGRDADPALKQKIVGYLLAAERARPKGDAATVPEHVRKAREHLAQLRRVDPETVREAERGFLVN